MMYTLFPVSEIFLLNFILVDFNLKERDLDQGPVFRKHRNRFGPAKPFSVDLFLQTVSCICLKLLV